ncbi:hypothetical protein Ple7327_4446 [Pleurocapsa sp. PCC 7327]|uniref:hypothetical protein n=1 Tax=Pleurocapsa sp. PCC 7327 TaxID=118163 RepID=UPI00029FAF3D|nr:hypothetical protein [Pleurocapsa sp. PCC 7327]AFY79551.1 hypothetical protein Ple7327_4446 [Pleurocapsa sp. PCC 7327]
MNQQSLKAYLNLIQELLNCPKGEEWTLLQQHEDLVNPELLQVMEQVSSQLTAEGNSQAAKFLRHWEAQLAHVLSQAARPQNLDEKTQAYLQLIQALLNCPKGMEAELLAANKELIDPELVKVMKQVAAQMAARGEQETAHFLGNLAAELSRDLKQVGAFQPSQEQEIQETTPRASEQSQQLEKLKELLSQLKANLAIKEPIHPEKVVPPPPKPDAMLGLEAKLSSPPLDTTLAQQIDARLAAIAESLAKLGEILTARFQPADPLWYMSVLERAHSSNWILTTEEVERLIGVKPHCQPSQNSYQRGCWIFVKVGKEGAQTAWRVMKEDMPVPST